MLTVCTSRVKSEINIIKNVSYEKNQTNEKDSDFKKHSFLLFIFKWTKQSSACGFVD